MAQAKPEQVHELLNAGGTVLDVELEAILTGAREQMRYRTEARRRIAQSGRDILLEVDGGVKTENIAEIARAGADTFVAGSAIFGSDNYAQTIAAMRAQLVGV